MRFSLLYSYINKYAKSYYLIFLKQIEVNLSLKSTISNQI